MLGQALGALASLERPTERPDPEEMRGQPRRQDVNLRSREVLELTESST